ncbi:MAG: purine phosphorylase [Proteobacteria bacterium]|nr:MAG: purine phosphorylase [Pseudomonadota bacterium]
MRRGVRTLGIAIALRAELPTLGRHDVQPGAVTALDDRVLVILTGMGAGRARHSAGQLIKHGASALLSWGSAVALHPELRPGSVIVPTKVIADDGQTIPIDAAWHDQVCARLPVDLVVHRDPIMETTALLTDPIEKERLARRRGAVAADMESAALGAVARDCGVPFLVVRAIADNSRMSLPPWLPDTLDELGRPRGASLLAALLRHPASVVQLAQLALAFRAATLALRDVRTRAGAHFMLPIES